MSICCWENGADRLAWRRVATNFQFAKRNIMRFACTCLTGNAQPTDAGRRRAKKRTMGRSCQLLTSEARTQPQQSMWYLWWAKWHFPSLCQLSFYRCYIPSSIIQCWYIGPIAVKVPKDTVSPHRKNKRTCHETVECRMQCHTLHII
jgi:hypothetical protein